MISTRNQFIDERKKRRTAMDVREFQEKLKKMQELAKEQGGSLRAEQIREEFSGSDLNSSQLVNVLKYLTGQGILIEGIETETEG